MLARKTTTFYIFSIVIIYILLFAGNSVDASSSGKYNSSNGCGGCHGGQSSSVTPTYTGFPNEYTPSQTYLVTIGMAQSASHAGFSFTVDQGTLSNPGPNTKVSGLSATHTNDGGTSWSFEWTAPSAGSGQISLQVAVNKVNNNGAGSGDSWNTLSWTIDEDVPTPTDSDGDGVSDEDDQCPNTPNGEAVNSDGCSDSQLDDDGDGVVNSLDQCPNTGGGEVVDANGCSQSQLDDDGDGVSNAEDSCENTLMSESVDANGCSQSQLDDDGDGVVNSLDQCEGYNDSIDVDNDQIIDGCDSLIDSDGDGVGDDEDAFPNDANETLDSDGDGIGDNQQFAAELQAEEDAKQQMMFIASVIVILIIAAVVTIFVLKKKGGSVEIPTQSPIMNFNNPHLQQSVSVEPTVVNQWTDQAGHTWRSMSDGSTLWWNGRD